MKLYKHNFIGHDNASVSQTWSGSDSTDTLTSHLATMPDNWYYRTNEISYDFNSSGHRSKELDCIDLDNYVLFAGCSHTEGVGLELSKTYPYLISQKLGCDYYNLGLGSTGIDTLLHNLIVWASVVPKLPKVLLVQWPEPNRYLTISDSINFLAKGSWNQEPEVERFLIAGEDANFFQTRKVLANKLIETIFKCTTIKFIIKSEFMFTENREMIRHSTIDFARDNLHFGIESNKAFANNLYNRL